VGDSVVVCVDIHQYLGDNGGGEAGINEGQVGQEKVHGGVEVLVRANDQDDEQVSHQGDQVHAKEESKQERLLLWMLRESQEQEV
jgi:hypothetical protein